MSSIEQVITKKGPWINATRQKIATNHELNKNLFTYKDILFCGKTYRVLITQDIKQITLTETACLVPVKFANEKMGLYLKRWYLIQVQKVILPRAVYLSNLMQIDVTGVGFSNAKGRWGSCDSRGNIKLNWRLLLLPPHLIDYIIVHELAHILELNHSQNFWKIVHSLMPDFKSYVRDIKRAWFLLELFR